MQNYACLGLRCVFLTLFTSSGLLVYTLYVANRPIDIAKHNGKLLPFIFCLYTAQKRPSTNYSYSAHRTGALMLDWTGRFGQSLNDAYFGDLKCGQHRCTMSNDRSLLHRASAVIFHAPDVCHSDLPPVRHSWQHYVFFNEETPVYIKDFWPFGQTILKQWPLDFFNLTMTYRRHSDIVIPFYWAKPVLRPRFGNLSRTQMMRKTKLVAWFVSNCRTSSKRERYVSELQRYISVDIYGKCGPLRCAFRDSSDACYRMLHNQYKFYLALENSVCKDYITEKLHVLLGLSVVPIVLKRSIYKDVVPESAFIALDDFAHPKELARYLRYLDTNITAYGEFFLWKNHMWTFPYSTLGSGWCQLCTLLHNSTLSHKSYYNVTDWYVNERTECIPNYADSLLKTSRSLLQV